MNLFDFPHKIVYFPKKKKIIEGPMIAERAHFLNGPFTTALLGKYRGAELGDNVNRGQCAGGGVCW